MSGLTAWERWELASFDPAPPPPPAPVVDPPPEPVPAGPSPEELQQIREQARNEGYQAGHAEGQEAAREEARRLGQAAVKLEQALEGIDQQVADELLALALEIARQVIRREVGARADLILDVVREALAQLPHQHAAIFLCPADASLLRSYMGDALGHAGHRIHEDPKLAPGDCVLESGGSLLDGTVATRWRRVVENLGLEAAWPGGDSP
jgi:flagellar assembly protein FliH